MNRVGKPIANPVAVLREEFDDWAVLFHPDTARAVGINPVGVSIWKLMDGRHTPDEIAAAIVNSYDNAPETAREEVAVFIDNLVEHGFVGYELVPPAP